MPAPMLPEPSPVNGTAWRRSRPASATCTRFAPTHATRAASLAMPVRWIRAKSSSESCSTGSCGKWNSSRAVRLSRRSEAITCSRLLRSDGFDSGGTCSRRSMKSSKNAQSSDSRKSGVSPKSVSMMSSSSPRCWRMWSIVSSLARATTVVRMSCAAARAASGPSTEPSSCAFASSAATGASTIAPSRCFAWSMPCSAWARNRAPAASPAASNVSRMWPPFAVSITIPIASFARSPRPASPGFAFASRGSRCGWVSSEPTLTARSPPRRPDRRRPPRRLPRRRRGSSAGSRPASACTRRSPCRAPASARP